MAAGNMDAHLKSDLARIDLEGLRRRLRPVDSPQGAHIRAGGRELVSFSSNDYLGLAAHPALKEAAIREVRQNGAGSGASRLISGSLAIHCRLEETLAHFKDTPAALAFSSGYTTAQGGIGALLGPDDLVIIDRLAHACIVDAARLSRAQLRVFRHNDLDHLESILQWADARTRSTGRASRVLIATESVFSMDGDLAPLRSIVEMKARHGAWLILDEAHATGIFGAGGRGRAQQEGVADQVEIQMGTLGKALGAAGGYVCGSRELVDLLVNRARPFIFSTAPVPAAAAAAIAGIELSESPEGDRRRDRLWKHVPQLSAILGVPPSAAPIVPLQTGDETAAVQLSTQLLEGGIWAPAIRYPTVRRGAARLRFSLTADHSEADLHQLRQQLEIARPPR